MKAGDVFACGPFTTTAHPTLDWETFSAAGFVWDPVACKWGSPPGLSAQNRGLPAIGARNYVEHPTFEVLSLAYDLLDGVGLRHWVPPADLGRCIARGDRHCVGDIRHPYDLLEHVASGGMLEAVNVAFEWTVWNFYCVPVWGWPALPQEQVYCCAAKARAAAYPGSLEPMGEVLKLSQQKDKAGKDLIRKLTVPRNPTKANPALRLTPITAPDDFQRFYEYNKQDVRAEIEASINLPDLSAHELAVWRADLRINMRGMQVNTKAVDDCIVIVEQAFAKYHAELRALTGGAVESSSEVAKIIAWLHTRGVWVNELDEDTLSDWLQPGTSMPDDARRVMRIRQILAFGSVKKLYAFRAQTTAAGRLHDQYVYYGAHTGLWNGRGVQPANLYKGIFSKPEQVARALSIIASGCLELVEYEYGDALEAVASCLRSMIIARPGCRLLSADFTAIQAVATSALAGEEWRLEVFRTHGKIYEAQATQLTGRTLQYYADYKKENGKHHDDRQLGKLATLSGDFGAWVNGWKRFGAEKYGDDEFIKKLILQTRNAMPSIVELWGGQTRNKFDRDPKGNRAPEFAQLYGLEGAAISAVLEPGQCFGFRGIRFQVFGDVLYCIPPSGGIIRYHSPRLSKATRDYSSPWELELTYWGWNSNAMKGAAGWVPMKLYGGVLTQNVVSHECREIQALALLRLEANGYPVVMHTHDENVVEVPYGFGSKEQYIELVRGPLPDWARTPDGKPWPIKVPDAWECETYGKWED